MPRLADALDRAFRHAVFDDLPAPDGARDRLLALRRVYALHLAPLDSPDRLRESAFAAEPAIALLKASLERSWLDELSGGRPLTPVLDADEVAARMRATAADGRLPAVYRWLAHSAGYADLVRFLAYEGGPDADFDDLVADCQVGLRGAAKDELARNYWDEMGDGNPGDVHTALHERMARALGLEAVPEAELPVQALARQAFGGLLATNHHLQPEMVGALGLTELQAGPRCRMVLHAFDRLGAPADARPFYEVHAEVDPRHGRDWLDNAVVPLVQLHPEWGPRILRGAQWRKDLNDAFFAWSYEHLATAVAA